MLAPSVLGFCEYASSLPAFAAGFRFR